MKNTQKNALAKRLAYHVTGAIERSQAVAIVEQPVALTLQSPRIRFNWGFHDAGLDREMCRTRSAPLPSGETEQAMAYRAGYSAGLRDSWENGRPESSEQAWQEWNKE